MTQLSLTARNFLDRVVCLGACPNHTRTSTIKRSKLPEKEIPEDQGDTRVRGGGGPGEVRLRQPDSQGLLAGFGHREQGLDALPDTDAERSRRSPKETPRSTQRPWARPRPGEA